ncbi:MAG TPA: valine--tRNA ligase [Bacilli bacterium]|nr:valine--tRNA ligase [Bacilli bacterium]
MPLPKHYSHKAVEKNKYRTWKENGYFTSGDTTKQKFSLVIPPPNVTGTLHLGHAWDTAFQDIIARYKKAQGFDVLWLPGMDHAGIATQAKIEERLRESNISRYDLGRKAFLVEAWKWKEEYAKIIREQWAKMGLMLDYTKERFTLDEGLSDAVNETFVKLYEKGYIYRGERIINWDPVQLTALSNIEVIHEEVAGKLYYFKYLLKDDKNIYLEVATTRPETMFADVCLVVNPHDKRYKKYVGKTFINPVNNEEIPLIADRYVEEDYATGVMKCTPAHDPNDFKIGEKYNLPRPVCLNPDATLNERGLELAGLDRFVARKKLVAKMESLGLLTKVEAITHSVGHSERSGAVVEPYISEQWFLKMDEFAKDSIKLQQSLDKVNFFPERFNKTYLNWMEIAEDWCISRQIWWGHQIPAYFHNETGEVLVSKTPPKDIENYTQDPDVLDTWFSSALWPFSTLGWPEKGALYERYYPTDLLVTGYDIIFFWVSRMIFMGLEMTGTKPFNDVVIHGLIRDEQGRKMSKSLGNGVDPLEVIEEYGVDSLRYFLATASTPGQDTRYFTEKVESSVYYLNKIWNSARFVFMTLPENFKPAEINYKALNNVDKFILTKLEETVTNVTELMDKYELGLASTFLYNFVYNDFCSNYLEMVKVVLREEKDHANTYNVMYTTLHAILMMIYPYSPFISEEIYLAMPEHLDSIMLAKYPKVTGRTFEQATNEVSNTIEIIKAVRHFKNSNNIRPNERISLYVTDLTYKLDDYLPLIKRLAFVDEVVNKEAHEELPTTVLPFAKISFHAAVDLAALKVALETEIKKLEAEIKRSEGMLKNPNFLSRAPQEKVAAEQEKYEHYKNALEVAQEKLSKLH